MRLEALAADDTSRSRKCQSEAEKDSIWIGEFSWDWSIKFGISRQGEPVRRPLSNPGSLLSLEFASRA
jgi:hypothetical protein